MDKIINAFSNLTSSNMVIFLEHLQRLLTISKGVCRALSTLEVVSQIHIYMNHSGVSVRLALLKIISSMLDASINASMLLTQLKIDSVLVKIAKEESAILVREMARNICQQMQIPL